MRILAASQSTQAAGETTWLGMGFLSYALAKEGIELNRADWQPKDGQGWLREWLSYAAERVPRIYDALREGKTEEFVTAPGGVARVRISNAPASRVAQTPALFDFTSPGQNGPQVK